MSGRISTETEEIMLSDFDFSILTAPLLEWYQTHVRSLPWRENVTPYRVWISEIMLQQTRVEAVKPYFERFMNALPSLTDLASCREDELLKLWEGLGYYNRARNLQTAARQIRDQFDGELPADYHQLLSLKGIGPYTAGAISSIAFGIPVPAVDGNVLRVIMRVCADGSDIAKQSVKKQVEQIIQEIIPPSEASAFNQALMELGATVCLPNRPPLCTQCPWNPFCEARQKGLYDFLPFKQKAKSRRIELRTVLIVQDNDRVVLQKRPDTGLLAGLYELPNLEGHLTEDEAIRAVNKMHLHPLHIQPLPKARHIFSHVEWHMLGYVIRVDSLTSSSSGLLFADKEEIKEKYPIPSAFGAFTGFILV